MDIRAGMKRLVTFVVVPGVVVSLAFAFLFDHYRLEAAARADTISAQLFNYKTGTARGIPLDNPVILQMEQDAGLDYAESQVDDYREYRDNLMWIALILPVGAALLAAVLWFASGFKPKDAQPR